MRLIALWPILVRLVEPLSAIVVVTYILSMSKEYKRLKLNRGNTNKIEMRIIVACLILLIIHFVMLILT